MRCQSDGSWGEMFARTRGNYCVELDKGARAEEVYFESCQSLSTIVNRKSLSDNQSASNFYRQRAISVNKWKRLAPVVQLRTPRNTTRPRPLRITILGQPPTAAPSLTRLSHTWISPGSASLVGIFLFLLSVKSHQVSTNFISPSLTFNMNLFRWLFVEAVLFTKITPPKLRASSSSCQTKPQAYLPRTSSRQSVCKSDSQIGQF
ncbi:hypothetical protein QBC41DRAFT_151301 [Cercophora samala]|uniref:Uncharacterized protein n=1 Tax=Cercophora samala TaxID=330535 RepID=A0AA39Z8U3_9PEZI|nr:hypothetical protein QBC41DRAFT_151301 [Cercophora samala]